VLVLSVDDVELDVLVLVLSVDDVELDVLVLVLSVDDVELDVLVLSVDEVELDVLVLVSASDVDVELEVVVLVSSSDVDVELDVVVLVSSSDVDVELDVVVLVSSDVDVELEVLVLVVGTGTTQVPSLVGFLILKSRESLFVTSPDANATLYESPPPSSRSMQPPVPGFGGTTETGEYLPEPFTLIRKTPLPVFLICADLIGPCSPLESLYLKPLVVSPLQNGFPLIPVPWGSANVWLVGSLPSARTVRDAPAIVGSPTSGFGLAVSLPLTMTPRLSAVLGFLSTSWLPRIH